MPATDFLYASILTMSVSLCLGGGLGPLAAGCMLASRYSWNLFFRLQFILAIALLIIAFFVVEESRYKRIIPKMEPEDEIISALPEGFSLRQTTASQYPFHDPPRNEERMTPPKPVPPRKTYLASLAPWSYIDHEFEFWMTILRSCTYFAVPAVFWVITTYGNYRITTSVYRWLT